MNAGIILLSTVRDSMARQHCCSNRAEQAARQRRAEAILAQGRRAAEQLLGGGEASGAGRAAGEEERYEQSLCTSVLCAESRTYYFTTPTNRRIRALCLDRETACEPRYCDLEERQDVQFLN